MSAVHPSTCLLSLLLLASPAAAEEAWEQVTEGPIVVKTRARPGTAVREIWAEAELAAPAWAVQATLLEPDRFFRFMPYVKESRTVGKPEPDGGIYVYTRVELPFIGNRDYLVKSYCDERLDASGAGTFRQRWVADPDRLPHRHSIERLRTNEGSWQVRSVGPERTHVVYRFFVDPGRFVPAFVADMGNRTGVLGTLKAVEQEAQRRAAERRGARGSGQQGGVH
ncbi:MAG: hypothetical protein L0Y66_12190 [Myxococcaceae bacterium]|nr:hypothetical protein [Myxococcaceae bacterium]MCI0669205.1 hypothetical protein [Myxococcaceae bacterium]